MYDMHKSLISIYLLLLAHLIHRDEMSKKQSKNKVKNGDSLASSREPLLCKETEHRKNLEKRSCGNGSVAEKDVVRVRVKMTKQEAARLMSKCKDGGILEFRDVAEELVQIPVNRVSVEAFGCGYGGGVLKTIPEEI